MYTFGVGRDHDSAMLEAISTQGRGVYYFIDTTDKVRYRLSVYKIDLNKKQSCCCVDGIEIALRLIRKVHSQMCGYMCDSLYTCNFIYSIRFHNHLLTASEAL